MNDNNFFSINNLVEFGIGMTIAQQMVKSMNQSIETMKVPGATMYNQGSVETLFYAIIDGNQIGPLSNHDITQLVRDKKIVNETYLWRPGMLSWEIAEKIPEVIRLVALTPPPFPPKI